MSADRPHPKPPPGPATTHEHTSASRIRVEAGAGSPLVRPGSGSLANIAIGTVPIQYPIELVVVAASTGGPPALNAFFEALRPPLSAPIIVVQHMAESFITGFAERLNAAFPYQICAARGRELIYPGQVWLAPGGRHLLLERFGVGLRLRLDDGPPRNGCRPSADETLASAVRTTGSKLLAVVLSGIGRDGRDGCRLVKQVGGQVLIQDPASAAVAEMPQAVAKEGLADGAYTPAELGRRVTRKLSHGR